MGLLGKIWGGIKGVGEHMGRGIDDYMDATLSLETPYYDKSVITPKQRNAMRWQYIADLGRGLQTGNPGLPLRSTPETFAPALQQRMMYQRQQQIMQGLRGIMQGDDDAGRKYQSAAGFLAQNGMLEQAKQFADIAEKMQPKFGQPVAGTDANGRPAFLMSSDRGEVRPVAGFTPQARNQMVNTGDRQALVNTDTGEVVGTPLGISTSPDARLQASTAAAQQQQQADQFNQQMGLDRVKFGWQQNQGAQQLGLDRAKLGLEQQKIDQQAEQNQAQRGQQFAKPLQAAQDLQGTLDDYAALLSKLGTRWLPTTEAKARLATAYTNLRMKLKDAYSLGAITGPDMTLLNSVLQDPTTMLGNASGRGVLLTQAQQMRRVLDASTNRLAGAFSRGVIPQSVPVAEIWEGGKRLY